MSEAAEKHHAPPTAAEVAAQKQAELSAFLAERFGVDDYAATLAAGGPLIPRERHLELAKALKARGYLHYSYVVASHWEAVKPKKDGEGGDAEHFEVAYGLRTLGFGTHQAQWRVRLELGQTVDSMVPLFAGADWQEREQFDLVGVVFEGHPDLRRLMMPDEWRGHPLRKDYAIETECSPWR